MRPCITSGKQRIVRLEVAIHGLLRRLQRIRVGKVLAPLCGCLLFLIGAAPVDAGGSFQDATGDSGTAPDITAVEVSNDSNGQIAIVVRLANVTGALPPDNEIWIQIDTDPAGYFEYSFFIDSDSWSFEKFDGTVFSSTPHPTASAQIIDHGVKVSVNKSDLGNIADFEFAVYGLRWAAGQQVHSGETAISEDDAPVRGASLWRYELEQPAQPKTALKIESVTSTAIPSTPKSGKLFKVLVPSVTLESQQTVRPTSFSCNARLGSVSSTVTKPGPTSRLAGSGQGRCAWLIPTTARRKTLFVAITAVYQGATTVYVRPFKIG